MTNQLTLLDTACAYVAAGLSVIPIRSLSKMPDLPDETWRTYTERFPTDDELIAWFGEATPKRSIGIVSGPISGGLVVIDIDRPHVLDLWRALVAETLGWYSFYPVPDADSSLEPSRVALPIIQTLRGHHIYFRTDLAVRTHCLAGLPSYPLIETRGAGGYVVAPPSPSGFRHPDYTVIQGSLAAIPDLPAEAAQILLDAGNLERFYRSTYHWFGETRGDIHVEPTGDVALKPHGVTERILLDSETLAHLAAIRPLADHNREATNLATPPHYDNLDYDPLDDYVGQRTHD